MRVHDKALDRFADFLEITDSDRSAAAAAWTVIAPEFPKLVEAFYAHLGTSELGAPLDGHDIESLKLRQHAYWSALFSGDTGADYLARSHAIARRHIAVGVPISSYVGAYGWFNERLFTLIVRHAHVDGRRKQAMLTALNKLIFLDMMILAEAYSAGQKRMVAV